MSDGGITTKPALAEVVGKYENTGAPYDFLQMQESISTASDEEKGILRDKYEGAGNDQDEILKNSRALNRADIAKAELEHSDTNEKGEKFNKLKQDIEQFKAYQIQIREDERKLEDAKAERREYYNSSVSRGNFVRSDHRLEKAFIGLEAHVGNLLEKMIGLKSQIVHTFEKISDPRQRQEIYGMFLEIPDEEADVIGLRDKILNYRVQENLTANRAKNEAPLADPVKPAEQKISPAAEEGTDDTLLPGIHISESAAVTPEDKVEIKTESQLNSAPKEAPALNKAEETAPTPEAKVQESERQETQGQHVETIEFAMFGPDGNQTASKESTTEKFVEDPIDQQSNISLQTANLAPRVGEQNKKLEDINSIKERLGLAPTVSQEVPPIKLFESQPDSNPAVVSSPQNTVEQTQVVAGNQTVDNAATQPIVQHFAAEAPEAKKGFFSRFFDRNNRVAGQQQTTESAPIDRNTGVDNITKKGKVFSAADIAVVEQNLNPDGQKTQT